LYSRHEISQLRSQFWTTFGQYMRPVPGAAGEEVNWINYKTGIRHLFFRMDAGREGIHIGIELHQGDEEQRLLYYNRLRATADILYQHLQEEWDWQQNITEPDGRTISRIGISRNDIHLFNKEHWPAIISWLKPRIIALDTYWYEVKEIIES